MTLSQEGSISGRLSSLNSVELLPTQADTKKIKREVRTKKKSSWFNFYPSYKSKTEDFKRLFHKVPDDERLVVGKQCRYEEKCFSKTYTLRKRYKVLNIVI
ncbi:hypothetical protein NQ315_010628 [Exocentrus adspersus]|uniref:Uncharacterized protein n=1 Tax=Exocentrus adspersus TaxID=1586481 RepID=A0AAV8W5G9_9CUCU|nr:hypothetical protein NQ315_010628 [Exocentrus adspersus]